MSPQPATATVAQAGTRITFTSTGRLAPDVTYGSFPVTRPVDRPRRQ
ncbi:hypothetical protein ACFYPX_26575 [Micromonospora zamorensis]